MTNYEEEEVSGANIHVFRDKLQPSGNTRNSSKPKKLFMHSFGAVYNLQHKSGIRQFQTSIFSTGNNNESPDKGFDH